MKPNDELVPADDAGYEDLIKRAKTIAFGAVSNEIKSLWELGKVFAEFTSLVTERKIGVRTVEVFAADLAQEGLEISKQHLYFAKATYERYSYDLIEPFVSMGLRLSHLKVMLPWHDDKETMKKIMAQIKMPDGRIVTVERLQQICNEFKKENVAVRNDEAISHAREARTAPANDVTYVAEDDDGVGSVPVGTEGADEGLDSAKPKDNSDGKTGSRGATAPMESSLKSPLGTLKQVEKAASKLTAQIADGIIAVSEAVKIGFDNEVAKKNFMTAFGNAHASLKELYEPLKALIEEMDHAADEI